MQDQLEILSKPLTSQRTTERFNMIKSKVEELLLLSCGVFENKLRSWITAVKACRDLKPDLTSTLSCSELQAHVAALERSLVEEKERCSAERQRRKELHNTLVVRTDSCPPGDMSAYLTGVALFSFTPPAGVEREHQGSLQGASGSTL